MKKIKRKEKMTLKFEEPKTSCSAFLPPFFESTLRPFVIPDLYICILFLIRCFVEIVDAHISRKLQEGLTRR